MPGKRTFYYRKRACPRWLPVLFTFLVSVGLPFSLRAENGPGHSWPERQEIWLGIISKSSMRFNREGYAAYTRKDYATAVALFAKAIQADESNCFAHFNQACTLSLMYGRGERAADVFTEIYWHLSHAIALDSHWLEKTFSDSDLHPVRGTPFSLEQTFSAREMPARICTTRFTATAKCSFTLPTPS